MRTKARRYPAGGLLAVRRVDELLGKISDEALLAACALGDGAALGALYDRLAPHVWRFLARMVGNRVDELEDLVQATFIAVHRSAPTFRGSASVRTWIFGIASNVTRRHVRDESRRRSALERLARLPWTPMDRPDQSVEQQQLVQRVREALSALPHPLRVSLVMCDLEGIPGPEAAAALAVPTGTLYRRVHDARLALRELVEEGPR